MKITLNGQSHQTESQTIGALLRELEFAPTGIAVAVNDAVVRRAELEARELKAGDRVEIIRAVQGG